MNEWGKSAKIPIRRKGFNCADLSVVELKASSSGGDTCATDHSIWWLTVKHGGKEGSMRVRWFSTPKVYMEQQPGTSVVCGLDKSEAKCDQFGGREQGWPGNEVGNLIVSIDVPVRLSTIAYKCSLSSEEISVMSLSKTMKISTLSSKTPSTS